MGTVKDEGTIFGPRFYPKSENMNSRQEFKELIESIPSSVSLPFPDLDSERISEFYLKNVVTKSSESLKKAFAKFYGDLRHTCSTYLYAKEFAKHSPKRSVYFYYWTYVSRLIASELGCTEGMGVCHNSDVPYVFGEPILKNMSDKRFSEYVIELWTNFAKNG